jgi:predicted secreted Zn-dependent protease
MRHQRRLPALAAVIVVLCLAPGPAVALAAEPPKTPETTDTIERALDTSPLLQALAYLPDGDLAAADGITGIDFTDWAALKAQHGGAEVTSASPLPDRQALLLEIDDTEATTIPLGLDRLATWPAAWGWDSTDLAWQLTLAPALPSPATMVLRFRDDWHPGLFQAQLERHGFVREDGPDFHTYRPGPVAWYGPGEGLERLLGQASTATSLSSPLEPRVGLTLADEGRTVVIQLDGTGHELVEQAMRSVPQAVAESPFGRVAANLGEPFAAQIVAGERGCSGTGEENALLRGEAARLAASVGPLRPYTALGVGYQRAADGTASVGRYVFDYERPGQAERDLPGRRTLIDQGITTDARETDGDAGLTLNGAQAVGQDLVLEVSPVGDQPQALFPQALFDELAGRSPGPSALFAICGPTPTDEPLSRRPTADVPLFSGPAELALSGEEGTYRWDEAHFGAHEVRVRADLMAGQAPCAVRLALREDEAGEDDRLAGEAFTAAPEEVAKHEVTVVVDYATAAMVVDSTCPKWSLRFEPVDDPALPYTLSKRFYPVRGKTIAELATQTDQAEDGWAAYASWETRWQFWLWDATTSCDVTHGTVELETNITYPRWHPSDDVAAAVRARWDRFIDHLTRHELGHVTIALQGADAIDELLDSGLSAASCDQVEQVANRAAARLHERYRKLNDRYDEETDHGITQGTGLS